MVPSRDDLVDVNEAARITGLKPATLYKLARQHRVRVYRVLGRAVRFLRSDVEALVFAPSKPGSEE